MEQTKSGLVHVIHCVLVASLIGSGPRGVVVAQAQVGDDSTSAWIESAVSGLPSAAMTTTVKDAEDYLLKYGYYSPGIDRRLLDLIPGILKESLTKEAARTYQKLMGIEETGRFDDTTMKMMSVPRCGLSDSEAIEDMLWEEQGEGEMGRRRKRYVLQGGRWRLDQFPLTYGVTGYTTQFDQGQQDKAFADALQYWADVSAVSFEAVKSAKPDIEISFQEGDHADLNSFDGIGQVLAHAFYPQRSSIAGDVHFDNDEPWVIRRNGGRELISIAVHEFGHALGLAHSNIRDAIMWPTAKPYRGDLELHQDDIDAIQSLYGPPENTGETQMSFSVTNNTGVVQDAPFEISTTLSTTNDSDICNGRIDAIVLTRSKQTMAFKGSLVYKLLRSGGIAEGYPRPISEEYVGYPDDTPVNAAFNARGRLYLFAPGSKVYRADGTGTIRSGSIMQSDIGIADGMGISAGFDFSLFKKAYIFTDTQFYRYSTRRGTMDPGYPKSTSSSWNGLPTDAGPPDAVTMWLNGRVYFFYGSDYYRFNIKYGRVSDGYPQRTAENWFGCK